MTPYSAGQSADVLMPYDDSAIQLRDWLCQACIVEVLSQKPGNVSPGRAMHNATVRDFVRSAQVSAPILENASRNGIGRTVCAAVTATHNAVGHNTNLGILLLLAPMAAVPSRVSLTNGIRTVLAELSVQDADWAYRAIRLAEPGGLGRAETQDVRNTPTETLLQCMTHAADRDLIAQQYTNDFHDVLNVGLDWLIDSSSRADEQYRIGWLALQLISNYGDSLIARKVGQAVSDHVKKRAADVLAAGWPRNSKAISLYADFDAYLRSDGNRLNPGSTADMIAAIIFAGLRTGRYAADTALLQQIKSQEPS